MNKVINNRLFKVITIVLFALITSIFIVCSTACSKKLTIEFVPQEITYRVGNNINCYDFIVAEKGVDYSFNVKNNETGKVVTIGDKTYSADKSGEYTLICTATQGKNSVEDSTVFNVYDTIPIANLSGETEFTFNVEYPLDELVPLHLIFVRSDTSVNYKITSVTYYKNPYVYDYYNIYGGDVAKASKEDVRVYDLTGNASDDGLYDGNGYLRFIYEGLYDFSLSIENAGGSVDCTFKATVKEKVNSYKELEDITLSFDNNLSEYACWDAVEGASSYRVKIDYENIITDSSNSYQEGGKVYFNVRKYLASNYTQFQNFDLLVFPLDANGKQIKVDVEDSQGNLKKFPAKITLKDIIIAPEAQKNAIISPFARAIVDENGIATAVTSGKRASQLGWTTISKINCDYIAWKGDYDVGHYVDFTFVGNNMPIVCFFADEITGDITQRDANAPQKGLLVMNGINGNYAAGAYKNYYGESMVVWGPNRMNGGSNSTMWDGFIRVLRGKNYELLTQNYLENDLSGTRYRYTVGTYSEGDGEDAEIFLDIRLYDVSGPTEVMLYNYHQDTGLLVSEFAQIENKNIIAYGPFKTDAEDGTFTFGTPYKSEPIRSDVEIFNVYPNESEMTDKVYTNAGTKLENQLDTEISLNSTWVNGAGFEWQAARINTGFISFNENYGVGTYVDFEFKGNNLPNVMFFANKANGNMFNIKNISAKANQPITAELANNRGLLLTNGFANNSNNNNTLLNKFSVFGMNRIYAEDMLNVDEGNLVKKQALSSYKANCSWEYSEYGGNGVAFTQPWLSAQENRTMRYLVGTLNVSGKLYVDATLYDAETDEQLGRILEDTGILCEDVSTGKILVYATTKGELSQTKFKIKSMPTVLQADQLDAVVQSENGTLQYNGLNTTIGAFKNGDSVKLKAQADQTYEEFSRWEKDGQEISTEREYTVVVNGSCSYKAVYNTWNKLNVAGGSVTNNPINGKDGRYLPGTEITVNADTPAQGKEFLRWVDENGRSISGLAEYTFSMPAGELKLSAVYRDNTAGLEMITSGAVDNGNDSYTLKGYGLENISGAAWMSAFDKIDNSYVAYNGEYGVGTYVEFSFTGNNMPQVMFFADKIEGNMTGYTYTGSFGSAKIYSATVRRGVLLTNGFYCGDTSQTANNGGVNTFKIWAKHRICPTVINNAYSYLSGADYSYTYGTGVYDLFTQTGLKETPDVEYKYLVGTVAINGEIYVDATLYCAENNQVIGRILKSTGETDLNISGSIVAYATVKGNGNDTTFTITKTPTLLKNGEHEIISLTNATVAEHGLVQSIGVFKIGDEITITAIDDTNTFKFAYFSDANGEQKTSNRTFTFNVSKDEEYIAVGKLCVNVENGSYDDGYSTKYFLVGDEFTVKANTPEEGYEFLRWIDQDGVSLSSQKVATLMVTEGLERVTAVYRAIDGTTPIVTENATKNADGSYTLKGSLISNPSGFSYSIADSKPGYVGFDGEFGAGYSLDITFKGNNLPQVMLFADKIDGKLAGFTYTGSGVGATITPTTTKGLLITNGYYSFSNTANGGESTYAFWGINRYLPQESNAYRYVLGGTLYATKYESGTVSDYGKLKTSTTTSGDVTAFMQSVLQKEENQEKTFKYTIDISSVSGKIAITTTLYEVGENSTLEIASVTVQTEYADTLTGNIMVFASGTGADEKATDTTISISMPTKRV